MVKFTKILLEMWDPFYLFSSIVKVNFLKTIMLEVKLSGECKGEKSAVFKLSKVFLEVWKSFPHLGFSVEVMHLKTIKTTMLELNLSGEYESEKWGG